MPSHINGSRKRTRSGDIEHKLSPTLDPKIEAIKILENLFIKEFRRKDYSRISKRLGYKPILCCSQQERNAIIKYAYIIKGIDAYKNMNEGHIFFVLIYILYSLSYNEQTSEWLKSKIFKDSIGQTVGDFSKIWESYVDYTRPNKRFFLPTESNFEVAWQLYLDLTTRNVIVRNRIGQPIDLSSEIRTSFMGIKHSSEPMIQVERMTTSKRTARRRSRT